MLFNVISPMPSNEIDERYTCFGVLPSFDLRSTTRNL